MGQIARLSGPRMSATVRNASTSLPPPAPLSLPIRRPTSRRACRRDLRDCRRSLRTRRTHGRGLQGCPRNAPILPPRALAPTLGRHADTLPPPGAWTVQPPTAARIRAIARSDNGTLRLTSVRMSPLGSREWSCTRSSVAARLQTLDAGAPVSIYAVARELATSRMKW